MRFFTIIILALCAVSCSESKILQDSLAKTHAPIGYLHENKLRKDSVADSIHVTYNNLSLDSISRVTRMHGTFLPLIFFNYSEANFQVVLGQKSIEQPYDKFFISSFTDESKRSGRFGITSQQNDTAYQLIITVDSCRTVSKYQRNFVLVFAVFAYSVYFSEMGFPAHTNMIVTATLNKKGQSLFRKQYVIRREQPFLSNNQRNTDKLRSDFTANMVESLSQSTKACVEEIIRDINTVVHSHPEEPGR